MIGAQRGSSGARELTPDWPAAVTRMSTRGSGANRALTAESPATRISLTCAIGVEEAGAQISMRLPSSTTRFVGRRKNSPALDEKRASTRKTLSCQRGRSTRRGHPKSVGGPPLGQARLALCAAVRQTLANGLALLGVSSPEKM